MTDPGAPPLNLTLQKLEAVLRGIEERQHHDEYCFELNACGDDGCSHGPANHRCDCSRPARVRAEQARTVERMVEAAINGDTVFADGSYFPDKRDRATKWAAALRAGEEHQ